MTHCGVALLLFFLLIAGCSRIPDMNNLDCSAWHRVLTYIEDVDLEVTNSRHQGDVGIVARGTPSTGLREMLCRVVGRRRHCKRWALAVFLQSDGRPRSNRN